MRKNPLLYIIASGILFLFFIQMAGTLVESIYILDLMHTSLDEKALGVLFFFTPGLLFFLRGKAPKSWVWVSAGVLILARGVTPLLETSGRLLASGLGTGSALLLLGLLAAARPKGETRAAGWEVSGGLALGVSLSVLLRTLNFSIDASLTAAGSWVGWGLGLLLAGLLTQLDWPEPGAPQTRKKGLTAALLGILLILTLIYFAFSAPAVIARWTAGSYPAIVIAVSLLAAAWAWLASLRPGRLEKLSRRGLAIWNLAFTLSLAAAILAQRVAFPQAPGEVVVVSGTASLGQTAALILMLLTFPVLFVDLAALTNRIQRQAPTPAELAPGLLLGSAALVLLVFTNIFSNVWGYIPPISTPFRNLFWLPFLLAAGGVSVLAAFLGTWDAGSPASAGERRGRAAWGWPVLLGALLLGTVYGALRTAPAPAAASSPNSLVVMTYNIQAGNDSAAEPAYERQLALIRKVSPDILALQESDTARISLNNNDTVRYYAGTLGYYTYYGPTTVTGTFGTAILSRYPLLNPQVIFSYSDTDEIGTTQAEIEVGGRRFTLYDVHPDGSAAAMQAWAQTLLAQAQGKPNVIALGDYNSRKTDPAYQLFNQVYTNAWTSIYPSEIGADGTDMSGRNRIDHIFVSPGLEVRSPAYILPPESATDHPVHWAEIVWGK